MHLQIILYFLDLLYQFNLLNILNPHDSSIICKSIPFLYLPQSEYVLDVHV